LLNILTGAARVSFNTSNCSLRTNEDELSGITFEQQLQNNMIRKLKSGEYRIYSRKPDAKTGKRRNLGTFSSLEVAKRHEREIQTFKHRN